MSTNSGFSFIRNLFWVNIIGDCDTWGSSDAINDGIRILTSILTFTPNSFIESSIEAILFEGSGTFLASVGRGYRNVFGREINLEN